MLGGYACHDSNHADEEDATRELVGPTPHGSAQLATCCVCPHFGPQSPLTGPVLPTVPARKCCTVCYLGWESLRGMEEVVGGQINVC